MAALNPQGAAKPFYQSLAGLQDEQQLLNFWRQVLVKKNTGNVLAKHIPDTGITEAAALAGLTAARDAGRNEPSLIAAISPYANVVSKAPKLTPARVAELIDLVEHEGHPARGEAVYSREDMQCITCHAIGGVGGKVGPDMTSLGASAPIDYLIESIYKPNAKIKENYHSVNILTTDGLILTGIVVGSDNEELILRDARNKLVRIPKDEIEFQKPGKSLMPEGLVDRLSQQEQVDLIKFLTQLGRPGNYDASKGGVARVYELFTGTHRVDEDSVAGTYVWPKSRSVGATPLKSEWYDFWRSARQESKSSWQERACRCVPEDKCRSSDRWCCHVKCKRCGHSGPLG
ncbi:MAG: hypothetical protein ACJ0BJ_08575 [Pirellulales bacterium]